MQKFEINLRFGKLIIIKIYNYTIMKKKLKQAMWTTTSSSTLDK